MKTFGIILVCMMISALSFGQYPAKVTKIESKPNATVSVSGDLSKGEVFTDLSWASKSSTACWPATQNTKFNGNHVLFFTTLPPKAKMWIKVIPDNPSSNMSIYAYSAGTNSYVIPPDLATCVSCEAEHKWDYPKAGKTQDHTREIYLNAINNPYNVVIGVAGADGLKTGTFKVEVKMEGGEQIAAAAQAALKVYTVTAEKGKENVFTGNLSEGVVMSDLSWAWKSSVACFPETQKAKFTGNHVHYTVDLPKYTIMDIELIPEDASANMSIYAYTIGAGKNDMVPNLASCVACEAEHKWDYPKAGKTQDHTRKITNITAINNPYRVVIGVTGADGLKAGKYSLKITMKDK
jgi:hypothetical protein